MKKVLRKFSKSKKHEISEDDVKKGLEKLQKITDECIKETEKLSEAKEKDVLNV